MDETLREPSGRSSPTTCLGCETRVHTRSGATGTASCSCFAVVAIGSQRSVIQLDLEDLGAHPVLAFLQHLELDRHNSVATRNVRLAATHAFFRYCALEYPARLAHCQRLLAVPFKRTGGRPVEYLEQEIEAILGVVDRNTVDGRPDYELLATMFNTGGRVQEIVVLSVADLRLDVPR